MKKEQRYGIKSLSKDFSTETKVDEFGAYIIREILSLPSLTITKEEHD